MSYTTIEDLYASNGKVRQVLKELIASLTPEQLTALPDGETWTVTQIVEHIAIVDESTAKICSKLLKKATAAGQSSDGRVAFSENFVTKSGEVAAVKVEAPEFVRPTGSMSVADSIAKLDATEARLAEMLETFQTVDSTAFKFPHPFFGEISAQEWLAVKGGHEMRHIKQIKRLLEKA